MGLDLLRSHPKGSHNLQKLELEGSHFQGISMLQPQTHPTVPKSNRIWGRDANFLRLDDRSTISTAHCG